MEFFTVGSGSSGNCSFVGTERGRLLIDAGISGKRTIAALNENDIDLKDIDGILISHEHRDHISCLGVLLRKMPIPVYTTAETIEGILSSGIIGEVDESLFIPVKKDSDIKIADINIHTIGISHDAASPIAFRISDGKSHLGHITDLGCYDEKIVNILQGLDMLLIEANHDVRMLESGIYPYYLKRRIAGDMGHLSNEACGQLLSQILNDNIKHIILGHLSAENNYDKLALESVALEINLADNKYRSKDFNIQVAPRSVGMSRIEV